MQTVIYSLREKTQTFSLQMETLARREMHLRGEMRNFFFLVESFKRIILFRLVHLLSHSGIIGRKSCKWGKLIHLILQFYLESWARMKFEVGRRTRVISYGDEDSMLIITLDFSFISRALLLTEQLSFRKFHSKKLLQVNWNYYGNIFFLNVIMYHCFPFTML